jgi:chromosome segregation ATPase
MSHCLPACAHLVASPWAACGHATGMPQRHAAPTRPGICSITDAATCLATAQLASKLDQAAEHQAAQQEEMAALQQELHDASRDSMQLEQQLQQAAESIAGLQAALEAAEGRCAAVDMQLAAAEALESELRQEVKQLRNNVEGLELERAQAGRAQASLVAKVERLKRVQAVAGGRAGQLEGYGEDDRVLVDV